MGCVGKSARPIFFDKCRQKQRKVLSHDNTPFQNLYNNTRKISSEMPTCRQSTARGIKPVSVFDPYSFFQHRIILYGRTTVLIGRYSDFPQSALPSRQHVSGVIQADLITRITAAGTVPDSHRIPLHRSGDCHQIAYFGCKDKHK